MKRPTSIASILSLLALSVGVHAATIQIHDIEFVHVGNPGNPADPTTQEGSVSYHYYISKNEVTIGQYSTFLNYKAKSDPYNLYSTFMASDAEIAGITRSGMDGSYMYATIGNSENKPITYVSWFDAARFANWMNNGGGLNGDTETGAYTLLGAMSGIFERNSGQWVISLPSMDEWYKAAYYDPSKDGGMGGYWINATMSDTMAGNTPGVDHSGNYFDGDYASSPHRLTDVGLYSENGAKGYSYYGTNDQSGNVFEWLDTTNNIQKVIHGGSWDNPELDLFAQTDHFGNPIFQKPTIGFRLAVSPIPEPASALSTVVLLAGGLLLRRRKHLA